jgi:hypothetical protein
MTRRSPHPKCRALHEAPPSGVPLTGPPPAARVLPEVGLPAGYEPPSAALLPAAQVGRVDTDHLVLHPGDTLVVRVGREFLTGAHLDWVTDRIHQRLPDSVSVAVIPGDELAVIAGPDLTVEPRDLGEMADDLLERLGEQPDKRQPDRNDAIRIAREWWETTAGTPERSPSWDDLHITTRAHHANIVADLLARGVIKP